MTNDSFEDTVYINESLIIVSPVRMYSGEGGYYGLVVVTQPRPRPQTFLCDNYILQIFNDLSYLMPYIYNIIPYIECGVGIEFFVQNVITELRCVNPMNEVPKHCIFNTTELYYIALR